MHVILHCTCSWSRFSKAWHRAPGYFSKVQWFSEKVYQRKAGDVKSSNSGVYFPRFCLNCSFQTISYVEQLDEKVEIEKMRKEEVRSRDWVFIMIWQRWFQYFYSCTNICRSTGWYSWSEKVTWERESFLMRPRPSTLGCNPRMRSSQNLVLSLNRSKANLRFWKLTTTSWCKKTQS